MFKKIYGLLLCVPLLLTGCGGGGQMTPVSSQMDYDSGFAVSNSASYVNYAADEAVMETSSTRAKGNVSAENQKLIRTVGITLQLESSEALVSVMTGIQQVAGSYNGHSAYSNINLDDRWSRGDLTIKIPKNKVDEALEQIKSGEYGKVLSIYDNYEDVTLEYTDIEARLEAREKALKKYMNLLDSASTIDETLSIQTKIDDIIEQIESAQARMNMYNNRIDYTEISINIECKTSIQLESFWVRAGERLHDILVNFGDTLLDGLEWFSGAIVVCLYVIPLLFIILKVCIFAFKGRKGKTSSTGSKKFKWPFKKKKDSNMEE